MTIEIFPGQIPSKPIESYEYAGNLGAWFDACDIAFRGLDVQPITVYLNGVEVAPEEWDKTEVAKTDSVEIRPNPRGGVFKLVGKVFNLLFGWLLPKGASNRNYDPGQGRSLQSSEAKANTAKLNQPVPEQFGYFKRYPDYLVPPRRRFQSPRQQRLDMLLCLGPGQYHEPKVFIGNTPIDSLPGAEYQIHAPGASLAGVVAAENWYSAPEVGGTSAGTAGLDLSSPADSSVNPTATSYTFDGTTVVANAPFPSSWAEGLTVMSISVMQTVDVVRTYFSEGEGGYYVSTFTADWREIAPTVGLILNARGAFTGQVRVSAVTGPSIELDKYEGGGWTQLDLPTGVYQLSLSRVGRTYTAVSISGGTLTLALSAGGAWAGFPPLTNTNGQVAWVVQPDTVLGDNAGPFVLCPAAEKSGTYEIDFFFPQGLYTLDDEGRLLGRSVRAVIQWRDAAIGGAWTTISKTYSAATLDQIGYTEVINTPSAIRAEFRVARLGARTTSSRAADVMQWYGARAKLRAPTAYNGWTTISISILGLGQIAANSENQVQVTSTRMLPTLVSTTPVPTRDITAAVFHIAKSVGYAESDIDSTTLQQLQSAIWSPRSETFDHVFDGTTAKAAIDAALAAGMAELTVEAGTLTAVREGVRTAFEQDYSAQNDTTPIERVFTAMRPDDNDGVEIEYQDEADGFTPKTVVCKLPGSLGVKLQKLKFVGVTSRTRAYRIGMRRASELRYRRWRYTWSTELDLLNSTYKGYVALCPDIPGMGQSASLYSTRGDTLVLSEPMEWQEGKNHVVAIGQPDGSVAGPYPCTRGANDYEVVAQIPAAKIPAVTLERELPRVLFGTIEHWVFPALITKVSPTESGKVSATAVNYDERVYAYDNATPPVE